MSFRVDEAAGGSTVFLSGEIDLDRSPSSRKVLSSVVGRGPAVAVGRDHRADGAITYGDVGTELNPDLDRMREDRSQPHLLTMGATGNQPDQTLEKQCGRQAQLGHPGDR